MHFLLTIKNSIYNPAFYRQIPKTSFGSALGYYLLLCLLVTLLRVAFLTFPISTSINGIIQTLTKEAVQAYPADLTIQVHNGMASINKPQPYIIPICGDQQDCRNIIIDTRNEQTSNYFGKDSTLIVLTKNAFFLKDNNGQIRGYTLDKLNDFTLNRQTIATMIHQISPWFPFVTPFFIGLLGIGLYLLSIIKLVYFLLVALLFWLLSKKSVPDASYGNSYKFVLYSITLGLLISLFLDATNWIFHMSSFPFMTTILAIIVFLINITMTPTLKAPQTKPLRRAVKKRGKK